MWTSNRGHIFRVDGIQCHNIGLFSNGFAETYTGSGCNLSWPNSYVAAVYLSQIVLQGKTECYVCRIWEYEMSQIV